MKISRIASWVGPAYVGSIASSWLAVTGYQFLAKPEPILGSHLLTWLAMVAVATPIASVLATTMLVLDAFLLKFKLRTLPTGGTAWGMAMLAPIPVAGALLYLLPTLNYKSGSALALALAAPVLISALSVRLVLGNRIDNA